MLAQLVWAFALVALRGETPFKREGQWLFSLAKKQPARVQVVERGQ